MIKALLAIVAVGGVLAVLPGVAAADPLAFPAWGGGGVGVGVPSAGLGASPCGTGVAGGQGSPSGPNVCAGGVGLTFVGPTTGQIAAVIGPTIISPAVVGNSIIVASGANVVDQGP